MSANYPENNKLALDTRLLSDFIFELNISRRCVTSYPKGHPLIRASMEKVVSLLATLLEFREEITLGIARDSLIFEKSFLDRKNPVYRDYAKVLFSRGIVKLTFEKRLEAEEMIRFNEILGFNQETIREKGGLERIIDSACILHIRVKAIRYDLFRVIENDQSENSADDKKSPTIWDDFVQHLLDGTLDPSGVNNPFPGEIDPEILAQIMNDQVWKDPRSRELSYDHVIASYIRGVFGYEHEPVKRKAYLDRLSRFVNNLNSEMRSKFLTDTFRSLATSEECAEEVLSEFPQGIILETLENMNSRNLSPSPFVLSLLQKLAKHSRGGGSSEAALTEAEETGQELKEKLSIIFREDETETLVPKSYQNTLQSIIAAEKITGLDLEEIEALKKSLDSHSVDIQISSIILEIFKSGLTQDMEVLKKNLVDACGYFLEIGDFQALGELHGRLIDCQNATLGGEKSQMMQILATFENPAFKKEVLAGLHLCGKEKYPYIKKLMLKVGKPFVEPVLDHFAEEPNRAIRRFYIDFLLEMGEMVRDAALARLRDKKWYFLRNLVLILRHLDDPSILPEIKKLRGQRHPRVREEVFRTLSHFQDPEAEQMLLEDLSSQEKEVQRSAVQLAEDSQSPEVLNKLLGLLNRRGVFGANFDLKIEVVRTLAEIGNPESLPHLERLLRSKKFLHRRAMNRLKGEVIRSLEFYPPQEAVILLEKFSRIRDKELADLASQTLKNIKMRIGP
jgi:HEAT repeats